jgi:hypothetical protein
VRGTPIIRPELIFRFEPRRTIPRTFDADIKRGEKGRKLVYRYRLLWAICEREAFFLDFRMDDSAERRPVQVELEEIRDVEFCCFDLAGITVDPPPKRPAAPPA